MRIHSAMAILSCTTHTSGTNQYLCSTATAICVGHTLGTPQRQITLEHTRVPMIPIGGRSNSSQRRTRDSSIFHHS